MKLAQARQIIGRVASIAKIVFKIALKCWGITVICIVLSIFVYWVFGGVIPFVCMLCIFIFLMYHMEDILLYHPELPPHSRKIVSVPSIFGLPYESVNTWTVDGTLLHLLVILQPEVSAKVPTILYLHGNAGNVGHRLQNVAELYHNLQCNVVMLEYRGYGLSKGRPSENGLYMDARAALDYLASRPDLNHKEVIIFGRSLGGAVGIDVAVNNLYQDKIWCLIVENTFTSIPDMANVLIGWRILRKLPLFCYKNKFLSKIKVTKLQVPALFLSGLSDTLVPPRMMEELHGLCSSPHKLLVPFPDGSHNETWNSPGYYNVIKHFITEAQQRRTLPPPPDATPAYR